MVGHLFPQHVFGTYTIDGGVENHVKKIYINGNVLSGRISSTEARSIS